MTSPSLRGRSPMAPPRREYSAKGALKSGRGVPRIPRRERPRLSTARADYSRLRTEWLRFKSQLFDALTGLPALPAVIEDVRRVVEARGGVEVLYLDLGRSGLHEMAHGWAAYDEAVREFAQLLLSSRESGALGTHDVVCLLSVRSDRFIAFLAEEDPR